MKSTTETLNVGWAIECPARCKAHGCTDHGDSDWRVAAVLGPDTTPESARAALEERATKYPESGPYRLIYTETVTYRSEWAGA